MLTLHWTWVCSQCLAGTSLLLHWCTAPSNQQAASELTGNQCLDAASAATSASTVCVNQCIALISWQSIITAKAEAENSLVLWAHWLATSVCVFFTLHQAHSSLPPLLKQVERFTGAPSLLKWLFPTATFNKKEERGRGRMHTCSRASHHKVLVFTLDFLYWYVSVWILIIIYSIA